MAWVFNLGLTLTVTSKSKNNDNDHNYNKILKSDWLSVSLIKI